MKILIVNHRYFVSGGPETYMFNISDTLSEAGHQVIPFSIRSSSNRPSPHEDEFASPIGGIDSAYFADVKGNPKALVQTISRQFYSFHVKNRLRTSIRRHKPDVVYLLNHFNKMSASVIDACAAERVPVVVRLSDYFLLCPQAHFLSPTGHCTDCLNGSFQPCVAKRCISGSLAGSVVKAAALTWHRKVARTYDRVAAFVCTNPFMRDVMARGAFPDAKLQVIPTYADIPQAWLASTASVERRHFLFLGRIAKEKGVDLAVRAFLESEAPGRGFRFVVCGGSADDFLKLHPEFPPEAELQARGVDFRAFTPPAEAATLMSEAIALIFFPKWVENLPNTLLEAYALGTPVVTGAFGSMGSCVEDRVSGLLCADSDQARSEAITQLATDPSLAAALSRGAREASSRFSKSNHLDLLQSLFSRIVGA